MPGFDDPNLLVGTDHFDDAGVYRLDASTALVTTLDFFPPLVDDPFVFGQIAAANALSDIYAMGAKPITALNVVGFPDNDLPLEILSRILQGGAERVRAAGAVVAGGHSVRDQEIKYGLSVVGIVHPDRIVTNAGARPGDRLVLTKPIGSGVLTSARKAQKIGDDELSQAIEVMVDLNAGACAAMLEIGVKAATDITGFGLIGHAFEMAEASGVTIEIDAHAVPLMDRTLSLAKARVLTRAHKTTLEHLGSRFFADSAVDADLIKVLADAQTSGGLLMAVAEDRVHALVADLAARETKVTVIVGKVTDRSHHSVLVR